MKKTVQIIAGSVVGLIALFVGVFYYTNHPFTAGANPGFFSYNPCYIDGLTSATSTVKWMRAGTATSTIGHSTLCDVTIGNNTTPKQLNLVIQQAASSTALSTIDIRVETSMDGKQWSVESFSTFVSATATTSTQVYNPNFLRKYQQVSTTTEVLSGRTTATTTTTIVLPNPTLARYYKVFLSVPISAQPSNVWAELRPVKEQN